MSKNNNIIKINGKRYDARTGANLSHPSSDHKKSASTSQVKHPAPHRSKPDVSRPPGRVDRGHKPKHSKTLMRHAVKKPGPYAKDKHIRAQGPSDIVLPPLADVVVGKSAKRVDTTKLAHAKKVPKSHLISHFSDVTSDVNSSAEIPSQIPNETTTSTAIKAKNHNKSKPQTTAELLEHAVSQAKSHEEPAPKVKSRHKRKTRAALASVVAVAFIAFVGYQELPNMKLNIASARAGFSASLPDYKPAGFSMDKLSYSSGVVATKFTSNSDARNYTLTQKASTWDSLALKENFLTSTTEDFTISESGGRTIFLYGNGNATWVNGGVWYIIQSDGSLSDHQLVELAKSV